MTLRTVSAKLCAVAFCVALNSVVIFSTLARSAPRSSCCFASDAAKWRRTMTNMMTTRPAAPPETILSRVSSPSIQATAAATLPAPNAE